MRIEGALEGACCARCGSALSLVPGPIVCPACRQEYPRLGDIPILLPEPRSYLSAVRRQLGELRDQIERTAGVLEEQGRGADVLPLTRARCAALLEASRQQQADIERLLEPLLSHAPVPTAATDSPASLLTNIHYLFRDWAGPATVDDENGAALAALRRVLGNEPLGRTIVLGAGACRLAYDLHRHGGATQTVAVDIDPLLLAAAQAVIRGGVVPMTEAYAEIAELTKAATQWQLRAEVALPAQSFPLVLADGLNPPFAPSTFDTVVTPWFIDAIPSDLRDAISVAYRLLRPSGRWLSLGPLRYTPLVPLARRFAREEVFDLAERAGFRIGAWESQSAPALVSKHTGRGKIEWVLAFCADKSVRAADPAREARRPPAWLIFGHVPVPPFSGQHLFWSADPLARLIASSIDGCRTLDDLSGLVLAELGRSDLSKGQIREAVRQCIADIHPACRS